MFSGSVLLPVLGFDVIYVRYTAIQIKQEILAHECCVELMGSGVIDGSCFGGNRAAVMI